MFDNEMLKCIYLVKRFIMKRGESHNDNKRSSENMRRFTCNSVKCHQW